MSAEMLPGMEAVEVIEPAERVKLTRGQRNRLSLERGVHPITGAPLRGQGTCGECKHAFLHDSPFVAFSGWKCDLNVTHGAATDLTKSWPACTAFQEER